jgi:DNA polymerase-3 subunit alpha
MFDLWGDTVPTPLPNLNLDDLDTPLKDKLDWEKELLGVYVSEHPLSSIAPALANSATALCGGIDVEMAGEKVIVAGMVTSIRQLYTRDRRPFVIAILEDLDGSIEVAAWSEVYGQTKEMWQEGKILLVEGVVKARDDHPTINCFRVRQYQTDGESAKDSQNGTAPSTAAASPPPPLPRKIVIIITQSDRTEEDVTRFKEVMETLSRYPGQDTVLISVITPDESVNMKIPTTINYCPELAREIDGILGENSLKWYLK